MLIKKIFLYLLIFNILSIFNFSVYWNNSLDDSSIEKYVSRWYCLSNVEYIPNDLIQVEWSHIFCNWKNCQWRKDMVNALNILWKDFKNKFWSNLSIISSYRSYVIQKQLFDGYVKKDWIDKVITYSAFPWSSEHQLWLAVDLFSLNNDDFKWNWKYSKYYNWLKDNAHRYGFHQSYQNGFDIDWYMIENWHWRYLWINLATKLYNEKKSYAQYIWYNGQWLKDCSKNITNWQINNQSTNNSWLTWNIKNLNNWSWSLPQEIQNIKTYIKMKYWWMPLMYTSTWKWNSWSVVLIQNNTPEYALLWISDTKKMIKNVSNNVKLDYYYSNILWISVWWESWPDNLWNQNRAIYKYTSLSFYNKTVNVLWRIYDMNWMSDKWNSIREFSSKNKNFIETLLKNWIFTIIAWRENPWWFNDNKKFPQLLHWWATNWWYYQIDGWCNVIEWHSIDLKQWIQIYTNWLPVWWTALIYSSWFSDSKMAWTKDKACYKRLWRQQAWLLDAEKIKLWKMYSEYDKENYNIMKSLLLPQYQTNNNELETQTYLELWKELQYMFQFYNAVSFAWNKNGKSNTIKWTFTKMAYQWNWKNAKWFNDIWLDLSYDEYITDLWIALSSSSDAEFWKFIWYKKNEQKLKTIWIVDNVWYKDILVYYYIATIWWIYNWIIAQSLWSVIGNAYVSDINAWTATVLYNKQWQIKMCSVWEDWWPLICKPFNNDWVMVSWIAIQKLTWRTYSDAQIKIFNYLLSVWKLKSTHIIQKI